MFKIEVLFCVLVLTAAGFAAGGQLEQARTNLAKESEAQSFTPPDAIKDIWDPAKYISIDEVRAGMEAYCLTGFKGTQVERFDLEVLSVVRNIMPGRDAILVQGTDERFIHTGPVAGASGSPVYIDGRLAGALSFAWLFSKDPLYGVTPIQEMLAVGKETQNSGMRYAFDFSKGLDFAEIDKQIASQNLRLQTEDSKFGFRPLPCPLIISGLPAGVCDRLGGWLEPFGFMVVSGGRARKIRNSSEAGLAPGACLAVPLVTGDISIEAIGTVTEVLGDRVYGLGHSFLGGYGAIDLPLATGQVHTVVSSMVRSFKFASALEIVGALRIDEAAAVYGQIGAKPKMIPLTITIDRYNDPQKRVYNCRIANNRLLTPAILRYAVAGAAFMLGEFPPDHMIEYKVAIGVEGGESITFQNVSTGQGLAEMIMESAGSVAILLNNPYKEVDIKSLDFDIRVVGKNIVSHIWSVDLSDSKVKAGEQIDIEIVVQSPRAQKKKYHCSLRIPQELAPGKYDLIICGGYDYQRFLKKVAAYRFVPQNLSTLIEAMNNLLHIGRDRLYCILVLRPGGVAVERAQLPDLPATKVVILQDAKRALKAQPYQRWLEKSFQTGTVIIDKKVMRITVEKR